MTSLAAPPTADGPAAPVQSWERLLAIDATRGLALLGIFLVNIQAFAEPFGRFISPVPESDEPLTVACFYFVKIFCEGKFYPLFSMLFGIGLVLQMQSVLRRGVGFYGLYIRRLLWLLLMGLAHALLLWYGDILFVYSIAGAVLLLCARFEARVLLGVGAGLVLFAALLNSGLGAAGLAAEQHTTAREAARAEAAPVAENTDQDAGSAPESAAASGGQEARSPFGRLMTGFKTGTARGPDSPIWLQTEIEAYRDGPWTQSFFFRAMSWAMYMMFCLIGFGWHVLGMFFIGAGLLKAGLFALPGERWQPRLLRLGLLVGLPGAAIGALLPAWAGVMWWSVGTSTFLLMICGPLVSIMYLSGIAMLVRAGIAKPVTFVLSNVGRMALTNYLTQTVVSTFVFYHWGLAQFASWSRPERIGFVIAIFAVQCIISPLWLKAFRFGPMEWLWRSVTYLRPQPMLRTRDTSAAV